MKSIIQETLKKLNIDLISLEVQLEISKLLQQPSGTTEIRFLSQFSPKEGLKSQFALCTVDLGLLMQALECRYSHQFTLSALFIRQGEPVDDLSVGEISTFIYHQLNRAPSEPLIPFHSLASEAA